MGLLFTQINFQLFNLLVCQVQLLPKFVGAPSLPSKVRLVLLVSFIKRRQVEFDAEDALFLLPQHFVGLY